MNYRTAAAFTLPLTQKKTIFEMPLQDYCSPGPIYNTSGLGQKQKSFTHRIGTSSRTNINHWVEETPSPAHYSHQKAKKQHRVGIAKADVKEEVNANPDPSWYNPQVQTVRPKSLKFSMGAKYGSIMDEVNDHPGPQKYEKNRDMPILQKSKSERTTLFASAERFHSPDRNPAVGQYQISNKSGLLTNRGTIGRAYRQPISKPIIPASTDYNKISAFDEGVHRKIGKTLSQKLKGCFEENYLTSQAFNKYFESYLPQPPQFRSAQEHSIPREKREIFKISRNPGPSDYNYHEYVGKTTPKALIAVSKYEPHNEAIDTPAPGTYQISIQKGTKYTIPRAKSATFVRDHPGVGRYTVSKGIQTRVGSAVPKSARTDFVSKNKAGVGDYQISQKVKPKGTIGKSQRFKKIQALPGPGDYHIQSVIGYRSRH